MHYVIHEKHAQITEFKEMWKICQYAVFHIFQKDDKEIVESLHASLRIPGIILLVWRIYSHKYFVHWKENHVHQFY